MTLVSRLYTFFSSPAPRSLRKTDLPSVRTLEELATLLSQINRGNVGIKMWTFDTNDWSDGKISLARRSEPSARDRWRPVHAGRSNRLFALDGETGEQLWVFKPNVDKTIPATSS
jgi:glucose dehydrogenase